jgi:hypothetical protein
LKAEELAKILSQIKLILQGTYGMYEVGCLPAGLAAC